MRVYRFLTATAAVTAVALVYVTQQTSLIRLSYDIKVKESAYSELLDRNKILLYNVRQLESPARLEKTRQTGSLAELAAYEPEARVALAALRVIPGYEDYADWLAERR